MGEYIMPTASQLREQPAAYGEDTTGTKCILEIRLGAVMSQQTQALKPRSTNMGGRAQASSPATKSPVKKTIKKAKATASSPAQKVVVKKSPKAAKPAATTLPPKKASKKVSAKEVKQAVRKSPRRLSSGGAAAAVVVPAPVLQKGKGHIDAVAPGEWQVVQALGKPGKEGQVFLVQHQKTGQQCAMKQFRMSKSSSTFSKEVHYQKKAAEMGVAPEVHGVYQRPPRLIMEKMNRTLEEVLKSQGGKLTDRQQQNIVDLCEAMDEAGIYHNDPNPLNLMEGPCGTFLWIDYGFSKDILPKKHGLKPNTRALKTVLHGGMQGLATRKKWLGGYDIITTAFESAAK